MELEHENLPESVSVYYNDWGLLWSALRWVVAGQVCFALFYLIVSDRVADVIAFGCFSVPVVVLYAFRYLSNLRRNLPYTHWVKNKKAYLGFDRQSITLLGAAAIPWSAISYVKVEAGHAPKTRRPYLILGLAGNLLANRLVIAHLDELTEHNDEICATHRVGNHDGFDRNTFLSLPIDDPHGTSVATYLTLPCNTIAALADMFWKVARDKSGGQLPASTGGATHSVPHNAVRNPAVAQSFFQSAQAAHQAGRMAEAESVYRQALAHDSEHADAWHMLGIVEIGKGNPGEAEARIRRALAIRDDASFHGNLGLLLQENQRPAEAELCYRRALELNPGFVDARYNFANLLKETQRLPEAEAAYRYVVAMSPDFFMAYNNLGLLLHESKRLPEAEAAYRRALAINPDLAEVHNNLGLVLKDGKRLAEAEAAHRRALAIRPDYDDAYNNLGLLLQETGRYEESEAAFRRALAVRPDYARAQYNLGLTLLAQGRYAEAWPCYECRYDVNLTDSTTRIPSLPYPQWQGESLAGKSLLIWPEQGLGDYIQFVRYAPMLKERGAALLTLFCDPALKELLETAQGVDAVATDSASIVEHDYWSFPMSLPLHFGTTLDTVPALPYLHALPARLERWRDRLHLAELSGFKVGLVWKGSAGHKNDANRSLPGLSVLAPLWDISGIRFFSLQKWQDKEGREGKEEALPLPASQRIVALGAEIMDLADTAAIVAQLDLVICVDTAVAHLAGALGKPCWVLLPAFATDWRWLLDRTDSPWYPQTRLFRQSKPDDWSDTINEVAVALRTCL